MNNWWMRLAAFLFLAAGSVLAVRADEVTDVQDTIKESYKVPPGGTLYIDIDRGNIEVESRPGNVVVIEVERIVDVDSRSDAKEILENHLVSFEQRDEDVVVESRYDADRRRWGRWRGGDRLKVNVKVQVPERYNVDFASGAGNVIVHRLEGEVHGQTGAGNIDVRAVLGPVSISSGAGNITLRDVRGALEVNTGAGNVEAEIAGQPEEDSELESGAGNVMVYLADRIGVEVEASTGVGSANTDFPLTVEGKWMHKSFYGALNGGGPALRLHTGVGNVSLKRL